MQTRAIGVWAAVAWAAVVVLSYFYYNAPYYTEKVSAFGRFILGGIS